MFFLGNLRKRSITSRNKDLVRTKSKSRRANIHSATQSGPQKIPRIVRRNARGTPVFAMIPNQIGLGRADYSAIADYDSVHPSYGRPEDFRKVLESAHRMVMLLYDFFFWLPTV